ncbi:hypothetical protein NO2_0411 [Candidatus Termititenax persephonae]|uniref:Uncharacterized protein n=1 Tax=Candidatus Termititenax persephonae TaxID=2218525 RepID=A0A388TGJ3_9BACT|nr:hypothetical protein NO2_0411 [Candidatus Termititenax persephonae]
MAEKNKSEQESELLEWSAWTFFKITGMVIFIGIGIHRIFVPPEIVGGDAYNYIIGTLQAVCSFILALILAVLYKGTNVETIVKAEKRPESKKK